jgi:hypothetical protein
MRRLMALLASALLAVLLTGGVVLAAPGGGPWVQTGFGDCRTGNGGTGDTWTNTQTGNTHCFAQ